MKLTHSQEIIEYMKVRPEGEWGGNVEDIMRASFGHKGDTTARRLRELVEEEIILCDKRLPPNGKRKVNYYTMPRQIPFDPKFARETISMRLDSFVK